MDSLSIFIIVVSVVLALAFKWVLFRKIQRWMDQDLIKQLAGDNLELLAQLHQHHQQLMAAGIKRAERHDRLHQFARNSEPEQDQTVTGN